MGTDATGARDLGAVVLGLEGFRLVAVDGAQASSRQTPPTTALEAASTLDGEGHQCLWTPMRPRPTARRGTHKPARVASHHPRATHLGGLMPLLNRTVAVIRARQQRV